MFDDVDPVVKQYYIFSGIISIILAIIINFLLIEGLKGTIVYGFPINMNGAVGLSLFVDRIINSLVSSLILIIPVYFIIMWYIKRAR